MKFVAILKTYKDRPAKDRPNHLKHLPDCYPLETTNAFDAESLEAAQALYPGKDVYSEEGFSSWQQALLNSHPINKSQVVARGFWSRLFRRS